MIKKPKKLGYPELLRLATSKERQEAVDLANAAQKKYNHFILNELVREFGTASLGELLFCVVEKYHKTLKNKKTPGIKPKWNNYLASLIRIEVDARRSEGKTLKAVIHEMKKEHPWAPFILNSDEQFKKVYKIGRKVPTYRLAKKIHKSKEAWKKAVEDELECFLEKI